MKKLLGIAFLVLSFTQVQAQEWETPVIEGYGKIINLKDAAVQPDPTLQYNLLFDIHDDKEREGVNEGLWKVARTLNMLAAAGVPSEKIKIVTAIHGPASFFSLNNVKYQEKYNKDNPNLELLSLLKKQGVKLYVCGQATSALGITDANMNEYVEKALSAISVLANYQLQGYIVIP
ncbi:MAG: DsrE family protein [Flavobacteriaceae bacterium]